MSLSCRTWRRGGPEVLTHDVGRAYAVTPKRPNGDVTQGTARSP